jgi:glycosyltransferase involved in cell wall biosynthesis
MPAVTVIIPTFNRARFLAEAVDSVLSQDFQDLEIVVVDDGSTDETLDILQTYPSVEVIRQHRQGVSAARNAGIARAKGAFIAFLDSDDLWLPKKLSVQVDFFDHDLGALICQAEEIWIRNGVRVNPGRRHKKHSGMIFEPSLELCIVSPSAVMMKRRLFDEVGVFDETLPVCEDYDLWLRISCRFPVHLIETPLVVKRGGHSDQLSRTPGHDRFRVQALRKILESGRLNARQSVLAAEALRRKCRIYAAGCRKRGRVEEADQYLSLAEQFNEEANT